MVMQYWIARDSSTDRSLARHEARHYPAVYLHKRWQKKYPKMGFSHLALHLELFMTSLQLKILQQRHLCTHTYVYRIKIFSKENFGNSVAICQNFVSYSIVHDAVPVCHMKLRGMKLFVIMQKLHGETL